MYIICLYVHKFMYLMMLCKCFDKLSLNWNGREEEGTEQLREKNYFVKKGENNVVKDFPTATDKPIIKIKKKTNLVKKLRWIHCTTCFAGVSVLRRC